MSQIQQQHAPTMKIGVLQAGQLSPPLDAFGDYADMFRDLFARTAPTAQVRKYEVTLGEFPTEPGECDIWLISGSAHGVYDGFDWLARLEEFVAALHAGKHKTIGVCFGHQLIAKVCGGEVERAKGGWCAGVTRYSGRFAQSAWLIASHQDQVVRLPEGARLELACDSCPIAGFTLGEHMVTVQAHPEFKPEFARALFEVRRDALGEDRYQKAISSLGRTATETDVAERLLAFFE
ncbi:MAG: hypothetical protein OXE81_10175 [Gammaproteobacteria bacterium]|nr:hypothetical protein [Gammaproteobacteria bacterium]